VPCVVSEKDKAPMRGGGDTSDKTTVAKEMEVPPSESFDVQNSYGMIDRLFASKTYQLSPNHFVQIRSND
jgi:hypothetical protein